MKKFWVIVLALLSLQASADQLFIGDKPFKGQVVGSGKQLWVSLPELVQATDLVLSEVNGNWVLHRKGETAALPPFTRSDVKGRLFAKGAPFDFDDQNGTRFVPLEVFSLFLGGRLKYNSLMQTVELQLPKVVAHKYEPAVVDPGEYTLLYFGASW